MYASLVDASKCTRTYQLVVDNIYAPAEHVSYSQSASVATHLLSVAVIARRAAKLALFGLQ